MSKFDLFEAMKEGSSFTLSKPSWKSFFAQIFNIWKLECQTDEWRYEVRYFDKARRITKVSENATHTPAWDWLLEALD